MSSGAIWIAGIYISALRALNVKIVVMNIYWRFLVKKDIFAHPWPRPSHSINFNGSFPEQ
jgi:hypothetical protein